jgi:hypothetical protein
VPWRRQRRSGPGLGTPRLVHPCRACFTMIYGRFLFALYKRTIRPITNCIDMIAHDSLMLDFPSRALLTTGLPLILSKKTQTCILCWSGSIYWTRLATVQATTLNWINITGTETSVSIYSYARPILWIQYSRLACHTSYMLFLIEDHATVPLHCA